MAQAGSRQPVLWPGGGRKTTDFGVLTTLEAHATLREIVFSKGGLQVSIDNLSYLPATDLAARLQTAEVSAVDVATEVLRHIDAANSDTRSFVTVAYDLALERAQACDAALAEGRTLGPLHGVPIAIKDLFDFRAGLRTTFGSAPLADFVAPATGTYVQRLEDAGAVIVGTTNAPEFGHKGTTDNYVTGPTSTPFDLERNAGGSSGGSAAAVAAGLVPLAQGTDGGGSVRIPAAWCGIFGMKPTFGRIPEVARPDAFVCGSPFSSAGPLARSVGDAALMLSAMVGPHSRDPLSLPDAGIDWTSIDETWIKGKRIAYSPDLGGFPVEAEIAASVRAAVSLLADAGAIVDEVQVRMPAAIQQMSDLWTRQMGLLYARSQEWLRRRGIDLLRDHANELTPEFRTMVESALVRTAMEASADEMLRSQIFDSVQDVFDSYDLIVTPTVGASPVRNADDGTTKGPTQINGVPVDPCIGWCLTYPFNFTGHPAASVPSGLTESGLPIGMQIVGRRFDDQGVLAASRVVEVMQPWISTYPQRVRA
jgi:Asp-tRNA(Asn)/Glu-tRNA(Gln) amidotransferase A subunit family amidase